MMFATPETGLIGVGILLVLLVMGVPIGAALGVVGIGGLALVLGTEPALIKAGVVVIETLTRYELGTLPLFLLMAQLFFSANASRDLFDAAAKMVGHIPGGDVGQRGVRLKEIPDAAHERLFGANDDHADCFGSAKCFYGLKIERVECYVLPMSSSARIARGNGEAGATRRLRQFPREGVLAAAGTK